MDGGDGWVKGLQDHHGSALLLARSLEHVRRNIEKEGVTKNKLRDNRAALGDVQRLYT